MPLTSTQTAVTRSSGRMSRTDAYRALQTISATAATFPTMGTAQQIVRQADALRSAMWDDDLNPGPMPAKDEILQMQRTLNVLVTDRLARSERATPATHAATVVCLYGQEANDTARAFRIASSALGLPAEDLRLVDVSPVQTDRLQGARWTIRTLLPHERA